MTDAHSSTAFADEHALAKLMIEFALAADEAEHIDAVTALFTHDGSFTVGGESHCGADDIGRYLQGARDGGFAGPVANTRHLVTNCTATLHEDHEASGRSEWMLVGSAHGENSAPVILASGQYHDRYRRVDGRWFISERKVLS